MGYEKGTVSLIDTQSQEPRNTVLIYFLELNAI